jgi:hypothetical protein
MRYYAQFYAPVVNGIRQEFSQQERQSYQKAFDYYLRGLKLIENRSDLSEVYNGNITSRLCTIEYNVSRRCITNKTKF